MQASEGVSRLSPRIAAVLVALLLAAGLGVRLLFWNELKESDLRVLLASESMDSFIYHSWAERIAGGDLLLGDDLFTLSPFYSYLVAPIYAAAGPDMFAAILVQLVLGGAAIVLMYLAGSILFGRWAGVVAAALSAFYGQYLLTEGLLLSESFLPFLTALFVFWTARAFEKERPAQFFVSGLLLGALFSIRPQYFLVVVLLPLAALLFPASRRIPWLRRPNAGAAHERPRQWHLRILAWGALGAAIAVAPLAIRNVIATGKPVMLTVAGGVNFYIGNNPDARGTCQMPPGIGPHRAGQQGMFQAFADAAGGGEFDETHSRYWFEKGLEYIAGDFSGWFRLMVKKAALFWNDYEVPVNFDLALFEEHLRATDLAPVPFFVVGTLGLVGLVLALLRRRDGWIALVTVGYCGGTILFFVADRYRVAIVPYMILYAGFAAERIVWFMRHQEWGKLGAAGAVLTMAFLLTTNEEVLERADGTLVRVPPDYTAAQYRVMAVAMSREGKGERAEHWIGEAMQADPGSADNWGALIMILLEEGRLARAEESARQAIQLFPRHPGFFGLLAEILRRAGREAEADDAARRAAELHEGAGSGAALRQGG